MKTRRRRLPAQPKGRRPLAGFTLIELLVVIALVAVLLGLAAPSFYDVSLSAKLSDNANRLAASAALARSEAIKRNGLTVLCMSANGSSCAGSGTWEQGWIVFHDANRNGAADADEAVLQHEQAAPSGYRILEADDKAGLTFQPTSVGTTAGSFTVCRATPTVGTQERLVTVSVTGRASVKKVTTAGSCT